MLLPFSLGSIIKTAIQPRLINRLFKKLAKRQCSPCFAAEPSDRKRSAPLPLLPTPCGRLGGGSGALISLKKRTDCKNKRGG